MLVENIVNLGKFIQTKLKLMIIKKKRLNVKLFKNDEGLQAAISKKNSPSWYLPIMQDIEHGEGSHFEKQYPPSWIAKCTSKFSKRIIVND